MTTSETDSNFPLPLPAWLLPPARTVLLLSQVHTHTPERLGGELLPQPGQGPWRSLVLYNRPCRALPELRHKVLPGG